MLSNILVVGLGNPEGRYFKTFHNVGFVVAEKVADKLNIEFSKKGNMMIAKKDNVIIIKPLTYMNRSGEAVVAIARKLKIEPSNIIVAFDDVDIETGKIRVGFSHTSSQKGVRDIIEKLNTKDFNQIRIGIKPEKEVFDLANYVLSKASDNVNLKDATDAVLAFINGESLEQIQQKYN